VNLYTVTCVDNSTREELRVYVAAASCGTASVMAISKVSELGYRENDYVKSVELIAGEVPGDAPSIFIN